MLTVSDKSILLRRSNDESSARSLLDLSRMNGSHLRCSKEGEVIAKDTDLPVLETLEAETVHHFPTRKRWLETFREMMNVALNNGPEGFIVPSFSAG